MKYKLEREEFPNDGSVTWTLQFTVRYRSINLSWNGPTHAYHPDVPDYLRRNTDVDAD